ncbi:MAG: hypothetical protein JJU29_20820 [Verrucomicrobia bacterium]|nr:hypothetical protein [Verrucomicrobiota bacterium]MCH8513806.1 hypothetical protein [Kiritimatiellia bacterium]
MITVDLQTFNKSREGGNVTGRIFLELQDGAFPENGWSDFPVIILGWWTDALLQLMMPETREVQWLFMDGPHSVVLTKTADEISEAAFELSQVHGSLRDAAQLVVTYCDQRRLFSKDLDILRDSVVRIKANQPVLRTEARRVISR